MQNLREWGLSEWVEASGANKDVEVINIAEECGFTQTKWNASQFSTWKNGSGGNAPGIKTREEALEMIKALRECARRNLKNLFSNDTLVMESTAFLLSKACRHQFAPLTPDEIIDICKYHSENRMPFHSHSKEMSTIYHQVHPAPPNQLFGRDDDLSNALHQLSQHRLCAIDGIGGEGKTALAFHIALKALQNDMVHKVAWVTDKRYFISPNGDVIHIDNHINHDDFLLDICKTIAKTFNWLAIMPQEGEGLISSCADMLRKESCLIVVDNLETLESAQAIVERLGMMLAPSSQFAPIISKVLFTSREEVSSQNCKRLPIHGIKMKDRIAYLQYLQTMRAIEKPLTEHELEPIAKASNGNPLLLQFAIERYLINPTSEAIETIVHSLNKGNAEIIKHIFKPLLNDLATKDMAKYAQELAVECTFSKKDLSHQQLYDLWCEHSDNDDENIFINAIQSLIRKRIVSTHGDRYTMHPLIRSYLVYLKSANTA